MAASTWSTTDKSASLTLTGSNLIATVSAAGSVRGKDPKRTGKYYIEYTSTTTQSGSSLFGFAAAVTPLGAGTGASMIGPAALSGGVLRYDVFGLVIAGSPSVGGSITTGSVICAAIDLSGQLCWFRLGAAGNWNGSAANNPATGVGGTSISAVGLGQGIDCYPFVFLGANTNSITANFGGSAFTGAVPAGFTSGWDDSVSIVTNVVATQAFVEQWGNGTPDLQVTQVLLEQWASVADAPPVVPGADVRVMVLA